jgi:hypothetical protein
VCEQIRQPGVKRQREDWELIWIYGMGGAIIFGSVIMYFKPDTRSVQPPYLLLNIRKLIKRFYLDSITSAALVEAKKRLEARGDSAKYIPSSSSSGSP